MGCQNRKDNVPRQSSAAENPTPVFFCVYFLNPRLVSIGFWQLFPRSPVLYSSSIGSKEGCLTAAFGSVTELMDRIYR